MKREKRPTHIRSRVIFISLVFVLVSTFTIFKINDTTIFIETEAGQQLHPITTSEVDKSATTYTIVIDPGHGGKDPGAPGISGAEEKVYTLALAQKVYDLLKQEPMFDPYITRTDDTFVSLDERANMANDIGADAFISIHGNTYSDPEVNGTETFYYSDSSKQLAQVMQEQLIAAQGFKDRGVRYEHLKVLRLNEATSILAEVGYLSNKQDEAKLLDSDRQDHIAQAIVDGFKQYFGDKV